MWVQLCEACGHGSDILVHGATRHAYVDIGIDDECLRSLQFGVVRLLLSDCGNCPRQTRAISVDPIKLTYGICDHATAPWLS